MARAPQPGADLVVPPGPGLVDGMTIPELQAYAEENGIDLGDATKKADILAAVKAAETDAGETEDAPAEDAAGEDGIGDMAGSDENLFE